MEQFLEKGLVPIAEAAAELGIPEKRLRGFIARNSLRDPIGDEHLVYGWSCKGIATPSEATVVVVSP